MLEQGIKCEYGAFYIKYVILMALFPQENQGIDVFKIYNTLFCKPLVWMLSPYWFLSKCLKNRPKDAVVQLKEETGIDRLNLSVCKIFVCFCRAVCSWEWKLLSRTSVRDNTHSPWLNQGQIFGLHDVCKINMYAWFVVLNLYVSHQCQSL